MMSTNSWSEEYDCVPLRLRLNMLHSKLNQKHYHNLNVKPMAIANCSSTILYTDSELSTHQAPDNSLSSHYVDYSEDLDVDINTENSSICSSKMPSSEAVAKIEQLKSLADASMQSVADLAYGVLKDCLMASNSANTEASDEFDESLDNIMLGERRKMLVSRQIMQYSISDIREQDSNKQSASQVLLHNAESDSIQDALIAKSIKIEEHGCDNLASENATDTTTQSANKFPDPVPVSSTLHIASSYLPPHSEHKSCDVEDPGIEDASVLTNTILPSLAKVKDEPFDINEFFNEGENKLQNSTIGPSLHVKNEPGLSEFLQDELDHMPLIERLNLLSSRIPKLGVSGNPELKDDVAAGLDYGNDVLESVKPINICRPRKKRRTATDSVETALEEDAPGLLKVLLERGVSAEEIKLYGEDDPDDVLDDAFSEDGFAELEAVISQLFSQRQTFIKFPLLRTKGVKVNYCLSCLLSLVEQTRYLRNRKWPVEWGWCRDLQSFIFVFQRHNRIVLERPEYGFATYFFELLNSVPVAWQIKRLVTAMKLTSCGRITLIENKPLVVGEDLSEGEAQVLAEYGWTPNTGLGTMLNYCDRVVHDRKQELDSSEWRLKIGKQLMNGYNGGNLVANNLPKKLIERRDMLNVKVKLEEA